MAKIINKKKVAAFKGLFSGDRGQRIFNYAYSIGASIVILGALFKLLHWKGADFMLILGMGTEAIIFFLSSFDAPAKDYKWENVFPVLDDPDADPADAPQFPQGGGGGTVIIGGVPEGGAVIGGGTVNLGGAVAAASSSVSTDGDPLVAGGGAYPSGTHLSAAASAVLSPESQEQLNSATEKYVGQINEMSDQLSRLQAVTAALSDAQSSLLDSYNSLKGEDGVNANYAEQMQALCRNISGLNTIYEIQLKSVSSQLDTIDKVNAGLANIRAMYENGSEDSFRIRQETEHMTRTLAQLNSIYERMLQAMTVNMGFARPTAPYGAQPAANGYPQQTPGYTAQAAQPTFAGTQQPPYQTQPGQSYANNPQQ